MWISGCASYVGNGTEFRDLSVAQEAALYMETLLVGSPSLGRRETPTDQYLKQDLSIYLYLSRQPGIGPCKILIQDPIINGWHGHNLLITDQL